LIATIVIAGLYVGREVLLPLALAILLSFVLSPALLFLRRLKVPRLIGVGIVVAFAFAVIFALVLLGESLHTLEIAGGVLIFAGIAYERVRQRQAARGPEPQAPA